MDTCRTLELSLTPTPFLPLPPLSPHLLLQLHAPRDAGQRGFWLDINSASHTLSLNVEDPYPPGPPGPQGGSDLWENVSVSNAVLKSWTITSECGHMQCVYTRVQCVYTRAVCLQGALCIVTVYTSIACVISFSASLTADRGDVVLSLDLSSPSHTLLPSLPPSHHHTLTITLPPSHNPMLAMERVFPGKQATPTNLSPASTVSTTQLYECNYTYTYTLIITP